MHTCMRKHYSSAVETKSLLFRCVIYGHVLSVRVIHFTGASCPHHCSDLQECDREVDREGSAVILSTVRPQVPFFAAEGTPDE